MSLRLRNVQVDVPADGYASACTFWAAALGATTRSGGGPYTHLVGLRSPVGVHVQRLGEGPARVHLDLEASDPEATVTRLLAAGATRAGDGDDGPVLADPAGLLLCVCPTGQEQVLGDATGPACRLDRVVLDVPRASHDAAVTFWAGVFDTVPHTFDAPFDAFTLVRGVAAPAGTVDLLVQDVGDGAPGVHVDLHVPDADAREAEVARLCSIGAHVDARHGHWVILRDPAGLPFCVVPDAA